MGKKKWNMSVSVEHFYKSNCMNTVNHNVWLSMFVCKSMYVFIYLNICKCNCMYKYLFKRPACLYEIKGNFSLHSFTACTKTIYKLLLVLLLLLLLLLQILDLFSVHKFSTTFCFYSSFIYFTLFFFLWSFVADAAFMRAWICITRSCCHKWFLKFLLLPVTFLFVIAFVFAFAVVAAFHY